MEWSSVEDIWSLVVCACCQRAVDERRPPKLLPCRHSFCLPCVRELPGLACPLCGPRPAPPPAQPARPDSLPTHEALLALARRLGDERCAAHGRAALWCCGCGARACRACPGHAAHDLRPRELLAADCERLQADLLLQAARRRDLLLRALDAASALKLRLEAELAAPPAAALAAGRSLQAAGRARASLAAARAAAAAQASVDDVLRAARAPLDWQLLRRTLGDAGEPPTDPRDPLLFLANYCTAQLFARRLPAAERAASPAPSSGSPASPLSQFPLFYFELEVDGAPAGRVVVQVRSDAAPRMARNFALLATGELGLGYRGCAVFQCWEHESVITGDFELNDGRGGRSAFEESHFLPDDSRLAAVRGAVGMRRSQKRHDTLGLVGSQFRIVLREMRGFTAIFGSVVEGLALVDRLAAAGDSAGKPRAAIRVADCGQLN